MMEQTPQSSLHDLDPEILFRRMLGGWYWLVVFSLLGGLLGWGVSRMRPPVYESTAALEIGINFGRTQPLSGAAARTAMDLVRGLLLSDDVHRSTLERLDPSSPLRSQEFEAGGLRDRLRLRQIGSRWELGFVGGKDEDLAGFANAWALSALDALAAAREQAWRAAELQTAYARLGCKLEYDADVQQALWVCSAGSPPGGALAEQAEVLEAVKRSRGILPGIELYLAEEARSPVQPLYRPQSSMILAGALTGFLVGLAMVLAGRIPRDSARRQGAG